MRWYALKQTYVAKPLKSSKRNNQCVVVVCRFISPSFKYSLILQEVELLLDDLSNLLGSPIFIVDDMNNDVLKQNILSNNF